MRVEDNAELRIGQDSEITLSKNAELLIENDAECTLGNNAELNVFRSAEMVVEENAELRVFTDVTVGVLKKGKFVVAENEVEMIEEDQEIDDGCSGSESD